MICRLCEHRWSVVVCLLVRHMLKHARIDHSIYQDMQTYREYMPPQGIQDIDIDTVA